MVLLLVSTLVALVAASPIVQETVQDAPALKESELVRMIVLTNWITNEKWMFQASWAYALDLSQPVTLSQFQCIRQQGYGAVFLRGYNPAGQGSLDYNSVANIKNAYSGRL